MQEFRRGGDMLNRPPHEAHIAEQLQHSIDGGSLKYDYFSPDEKNRLSVFASAAITDLVTTRSKHMEKRRTSLRWAARSMYTPLINCCSCLPI